MRLRRIEVCNFGKLRHAVIESLSDGLNVVVGDNEVGKSTLLAALRSALFERHRVTGETAEAMLPFGAQVRPEVLVEFEIDGQPWRLRKAFAQRPEAELAGAGERLQGDAAEDASAERDRIEAAFQAYDGKVTELGRRQEELARHASEDRLAGARRDLAAARQAVAETERLGQALREGVERHKRAKAERDAAAARVAAREALVAALMEARSRLARDRDGEADAAAVLQARGAAVDKAARRLAAMEAERSKAEAEARAIEAVLAFRQLSVEVSALEARVAACAEADASRRAARAAVAALPITGATLARIEALQVEADAAAPRLGAASVGLSFAPDGPRGIRPDGVEHDPARPLRLARDAELRLEGFGTLRVRPGGGALELAQRAEAARMAVGEALRALGLAGVVEARAALARRLEAEKEAKAQARVVTALAPDGVDALTQLLADRQARLGRVGSLETAGQNADEAALADARDRTAMAAQAAASAEADAKQAESDRTEVQVEAVRLAERLASVTREVEAHRLALEAARAEKSDGALTAALAAAEAAVVAEAAAEALARAALAASDPEVVRLRLQRAERAEAAIREDLERLMREKRDLEVELAALGSDGLGERLAEADGELALKRTRLERAEREAAASLLLHETLEAAQREFKDRWLAPVRRRVAPYLRLIHPDGDVVLDEDTLELHGVVRDGRREPFATLSQGAREQVAVITRLALAEVLIDAGHPATVILNDALVNTDDGRLEAMHLALHRAAEWMQILVLTCRERDFVGLGAPIHRLR